MSTRTCGRIPCTLTSLLLATFSMTLRELQTRILLLRSRSTTLSTHPLYYRPHFLVLRSPCQIFFHLHHLFLSNSASTLLPKSQMYLATRRCMLSTPTYLVVRCALPRTIVRCTLYRHPSGLYVGSMACTHPFLLHFLTPTHPTVFLASYSSSHCIFVAVFLHASSTIDSLPSPPQTQTCVAYVSAMGSTPMCAPLATRSGSVAIGTPDPLLIVSVHAVFDSASKYASTATGIGGYSRILSPMGVCSLLPRSSNFATIFVAVLSTFLYLCSRVLQPPPMLVPHTVCSSNAQTLVCTLVHLCNPSPIHHPATPPPHLLFLVSWVSTIGSVRPTLSHAPVCHLLLHPASISRLLVRISLYSQSSILHAIGGVGCTVSNLLPVCLQVQSNPLVTSPNRL
uniref:Uncharacterized protein n=2 Tax=Lygus hesperus TaxID=30085 RepID=A0A0A9ZGF1_LYGHE